MNAKKITLVLILIIVHSLCFCQEYWEVIYEDEATIRCIEKDIIGNLYLGTQDCMYISYDNGLSWNETNFQGCCISFLFELDTLFVSNVDGIYISFDNGATWQLTNFPATAGPMMKDSSNNLFAANWGHIYKSTDDGNAWNIVLSTNSNEIFNDLIETSEGLFAASQHYMGEGGLYRSIDQGDNWELIGLNYHFLSSLAINSNGELFAGSRGHYTQAIGGVYRSSDNGETWETLTNQFYVTDMVIDSQDRIFVGCNEYTGFVWMSEDDGETWNQLESQIMTIAEIQYLTISEDDHLYAISYGDYPVNKVYRSLDSTKINGNTIKINSCELSNFPNPFNPNTHIRFALDYNSHIKLVIYNTKGQSVRTLANENVLDELFYEYSWNGMDDNGNQVSSGIYMYKLVTDQETFTKKMIMLK